MTSAINPNNIDGNYPVSGVPNNTQGFRDNFTNIKTNFSSAATEISDLQSKAVLKAALSGTTLDNNMNDNLLYAVKLQDLSYTYVPNTATSGAIALDYSAGQFQAVPSTTGSISLSFTNWPESGSAGYMIFSVNITNTSYTLTLPSAVSVGTTGIQGYSANVITFGATGTYKFAFMTTDGGTTITIFDLNRPLTSYTNAFGYIAGAGGTVTQATNKATAVTLNKPSGEITMNNAALASATTVNFTLNNSVLSATDLLLINQSSTANAGGYHFNAICNSGNAQISVRNIMASSASDAVVLRYAVIRGSIT